MKREIQEKSKEVCEYCGEKEVIPVIWIRTGEIVFGGHTEGASVKQCLSCKMIQG